MRYGSVCSGIEAATVAWEPLGFTPAWFAEIDDWPSSALAHHYPNVPNFGDLNDLPQMMRMGLIEAPDILVGGTPCQSFSIAGLRKGMECPRGQLTLKYVELLNAIDEQRPGNECIALWENVPGVLSHKDNPFGCFLAALCGEDEPLKPTGQRWPNAGVVYGPQRAVTWRVLDAQYFGLAQRRKRVFVVASARSGYEPEQVLFEFEGVRRDTPPSRISQKETAPHVGRSVAFDRQSITNYGTLDVASSLRSRDDKSPTDLIVTHGTQCGFSKATQQSIDAGHLVTYSLAGNVIGRQPQHGGNQLGVGQGDAMFTLTTADIHAVVYPINTMNALGREGEAENSRTGLGIGEPTAPQATLTKEHSHGVAYCTMSDPVKALCARDNKGVGSQYFNEGKVVAIPYDTTQVTSPGNRSNPTADSPCHTLLAKSDAPLLIERFWHWIVRRLTPIECERLQGFPDNYTNIPGTKDCHRYSALGNSMAVDVMAFIGKRLVLGMPK